MFSFSYEVNELSKKAMEKSERYFSAIDDITRYNQHKMLKAFIDNNVSESMFSESTGFAYGD